MKKVLFIFLLFLLVTANASARDYFVKQDGTGDFTTIQACANVAIAGDSCIVSAGRYDERVYAKNSGLSGSFIEFKTSEGSVVKGFSLTGKSYIKIDGFKLTHESFVRETYATASIFMESVNNIVLTNNIIR